MRIHDLSRLVNDESLRSQGYVHRTLQILVLVEHAVELLAVALSHRFCPGKKTAVIDRHGYDIEIHLCEPVFHDIVQSIQLRNARLACYTPERDDRRLVFDYGTYADSLA